MISSSFESANTSRYVNLYTTGFRASGGFRASVSVSARASLRASESACLRANARPISSAAPSLASASAFTSAFASASALTSASASAHACDRDRVVSAASISSSIGSNGSVHVCACALRCSSHTSSSITSLFDCGCISLCLGFRLRAQLEERRALISSLLRDSTPATASAVSAILHASFRGHHDYHVGNHLNDSCSW